MERLQLFPDILEDSSSDDERRPRIVHERNSFFDELDDVDFRKRFRLSKDTLLHLAELLDPRLEPISARNQPISKLNQILITLRFYATGSYQLTIADIFKVSQPTVSRIVTRITRHIARLRPNFIAMPETSTEKQKTAETFYDIGNFPLVIGALDCTHVKIISPGGNVPEVFRNRKEYFSINTQAIGDANLEILDIVARWPGSIHDTTIFNDSHIRARFENNEFGHYHLLGDGGYPCRSYLLTPLHQPTTGPEERYNKSQIATRNPIERLFGVLKKRFPCLARGMSLSPTKVCEIIVATAVLHNICRRENDGDDDFEELDPGEEEWPEDDAPLCNITEKQCNDEIKTEDNPHIYKDGIADRAARLFDAELPSMECERPSGVKDVTINDTTDNSTSSYKCEVYNESFVTKKYLAQHMKIHAKQEPDKLCEDSDNEFINGSNTSVAIKIKNEFSEEDTLINYGEVDYDEQSRREEFEFVRVKEEQCDIEIKTEPKWDIDPVGTIDVARCPSELEPSSSNDSQCTHRCELCNKSFSTKRSLTQHVKLHTGEKSHKCDICHKLFSQKHRLESHSLLHSGTQPYKCDICQKTFSRKDHLVSHKLLHSGKQTHKCESCGKVFSRKDRLVAHIKLHTGENSNKCEICKKTFVRKDFLVSHSRLHTGEKPFKCEVCKKRFSQKANFVAHNLVHTGENLRYECEVCGKKFSRKDRLVSHVRIHTKEKPFKCSICDKKFSRISNFLVHIKLH